MMKKQILLTLALGATVWQPIAQAYPHAPYSVAITDEAGKKAGITTAVVSPLVGAGIVRMAKNALIQYFPKNAATIQKISFALPRTTIQAVANLNPYRMTLVSTMLGVWMAYFFWYQITASKQVKRAHALKELSGLSTKLEQARNDVNEILRVLNQKGNPTEFSIRKAGHDILTIKNDIASAVTALKSANKVTPGLDNELRQFDALCENLAHKMTTLHITLDGFKQKNKNGIVPLPKEAMGDTTYFNQKEIGLYKKFKKYIDTPHLKPLLVGVEAVEYFATMMTNPRIVGLAAVTYFSPEILGVTALTIKTCIQLLCGSPALAQ